MAINIIIIVNICRLVCIGVGKHPQPLLHLTHYRQGLSIKLRAHPKAGLVPSCSGIHLSLVFEAGITDVLHTYPGFIRVSADLNSGRYACTASLLTISQAPGYMTLS